MALTAEQRRLARVHLRIPQVAALGFTVSGVPDERALIHSFETALDELTADGETTVIALLAELEAARSATTTHYARAGVLEVEDIKLSDSSRGLNEKRSVYASLVADLAACLGVDPPSRSGNVWAEP